MMSSATMPETHSLTPSRTPARQGLALAVADVGWFNTENLFREIDRDRVAVLLAQMPGLRKRLAAWALSLVEVVPAAPERALVMGTAARASYRLDEAIPAVWECGRWPARSAAGGSRSPPAVGAGWSCPTRIICTSADRLQPDVSVYYNIDDYSLYWPDSAARVRELEREVVLAADITVCVSRLRAEELIAMVPEAAARIHHVPHGTPTPFLADVPLVRGRPRPRPSWRSCPAPISAMSARSRIGWTGSFSAGSAATFRTRRSWWSGAWSMQCPSPGGRIAHASFPAPTSTPWAGGPRLKLPRYYQAFDVCMIPYQDRSSVQPRLQPDQDHGRDGLWPADRRDRDPGVPPARRAVRRRREPR